MQLKHIVFVTPSGSKSEIRSSSTVRERAALGAGW
jgi:hypothetical protein